MRKVFIRETPPKNHMRVLSARLPSSPSRGISLRKIVVAVFLILLSTLTALPSLNTILARAQTSDPWSFRDDFNYNSIDQLQAAGWTTGGGAPPSYFNVSNGILTLLNDGYVGAAVEWNHAPAGVTNWSVSLRGEWVGNWVGSIGLIVYTVGHTYSFLADGYYPRFGVGRDGIGVTTFPGYTPQLNVWHVLQMDMYQGTLYLYFDGSIVGSYTEQDATPNNTNLTGIATTGAWNTNNSFDWVQATDRPGPFFAIVSNPSAMTVLAGQTGSSTINITSQAGFAGSVSLTEDVVPTSVPLAEHNPPTGPLVALNPSTVDVPAGGSATSTLTVQFQDSTNPGYYSITVTGTNGNLSRSVNLNVALPDPDQFPFRDDFYYNSIDDMNSNGWTQCGQGASQSYQVSNGLLTLEDGAAMCWSHVPSGVSNWTATFRGQWYDNPYPSTGVEVVAQTSSHVYKFAAGEGEGLVVYRDGAIVINSPGWRPYCDYYDSYYPCFTDFGVWHNYHLVMNGGILTAYFDSNIVGTYTESDPATELVLISPMSGSDIGVLWDSVTASSPPRQSTVPLPFRDDFDYNSIDQLQEAGWSTGGGTPASYFSVGNGTLTLLNDGYAGASVDWSHVPANISDWTVSLRGEWIGNSVGSIGLTVRTTGHTYNFLADGYYPQFGFGRDGIGVAAFPGYTPELNVWHVLRLDMVQGTLYLFFDGMQVGSYNETDTTPGNTNLTGIATQGAWETDNSFDWVQAADLDPRIQQTTTFDGLSVSISGSLTQNTALKTMSGTVSATVTNSATGQMAFSKNFSVSVGYGSSSTTRFVLSMRAGSSWLGAACSVNVSTDTASCTVSRDPDVDHDGVINLLDVSQVFLAYGSSTGDARYNPSLDLCGHGTVDILDASLVAFDYGLPVFS